MTFEFNLGGYYATNYWVNYKKGALHCYTSNYPLPPLPDDEFLIVPLQDNKDWITLMDYLTACKWDREYLSFVDDGIQWELKVKDKGINIKTYGSNAYPKDFATFLELLNRVITVPGIIIPDCS